MVFVFPLTSNLSVGDVVPIPTFPPLLNMLLDVVTQLEPFQYGVSPALSPLVKNPEVPLVPLEPLVPDVPLVPLVPDVPFIPDVPSFPLKTQEIVQISLLVKTPLAEITLTTMS